VSPASLTDACWQVCGLRDQQPTRAAARRSKVAAFDLTFSAPKSVSVLFAVGDPDLGRALVEAHEEAVGALPWAISSVRRVGFDAAAAGRCARRGRGSWRRRIAIA
jgi:hypothetical protein